ncbi:hypothetical protein HAX54_025558 [Datura stramonium]|uniref:Uncharacterized protein n=1 Tax=Datura stramonium TaxID=4076 RepID=A0ABS8S6Y6_DATST|nr:hypothetical protein [Datura stramonium]
MGRKTSKKHAGVNADHTIESVSGGNADDNNRPRKDKRTTPVPQASFLRKQVDPETAKYFAEIANAIEADRSGSHVVETALKSLSFHLQDNENHSLIEQTLKKICKALLPTC